MNFFDWSIIIGISITILLFISFILFFMSSIRIKKVLNKQQKNKPKSKRKRKKWSNEIKLLKKKKSSQIRFMIFSIIGVFIIGGATGYARWYQSTNLQDTDMDSLVYGYYLVDQIDKQLKDAEGENSKKNEENIHKLSLQISSYSSKKASDKGTKESQILINRYYARLGQFGINLASQNYDGLKENIAEYQQDIVNIKTAQKQVLDFYKINENSLKQKK